MNSSKYRKDISLTNLLLLQEKSLRDWFKKEKWVRISSSGEIAGPCGTSKNKKNPDRCLPAAKARSLSKGERAATAQKKKREGSKGKTVVANTKKAKVTREDIVNIIREVITEKDDRCTRIAKRKYDTWPSAYASGAVVRCRRGEIWKNEVVTPADPKKVDSNELKMGIKVEMEHTNDPKQAKKIALQHLAEDPKYYTKLKSLNLEDVHEPVNPGILKKRLGKLSCSKVRAERAKLKDKGTTYAKALQRYLNYHCKD